MYSRMKPKYVEHLETQEGVFSCLEFHRYPYGLIQYLDEKKFTRVFERGVVSSRGKARWIEVVYRTNQKFYFHVNSANQEEDECELTIYYKPEQFSELIFLTTQVLKPYKEAKINQETIETEKK